MGQDWADLPVPTEAGPGQTWQLQKELSDDFNYKGKKKRFRKRWNDHYFNKWTGPGLTQWQDDHSSVENGHLVIRASRREGTDQVNCGIITGKADLMYPVYTEARIKVSNLELSSNFWFLSRDSRREIDVLEVYGGAAKGYFAQNMSTNFHVFIRSKAEGITSDFNAQNHVMLPGSAYWWEDYHTFGMFWKSPTEVYFYIDGKQLPTGSWDQSDMFDKDYTKTPMDKTKYVMDKPLVMILDTEDHHWRSNQGIVAKDEDLANPAKNRMLVDWVRTYRLVRER
jgi:agarase